MKNTEMEVIRLSSLAAQEVVKMTVDSDENFAKW